MPHEHRIGVPYRRTAQSVFQISTLDRTSLIRQLRACAPCIAGLCLLGLALTWVIPELAPPARRMDASVLRAFTHLDSGLVRPTTRVFLHLIEDRVFFAVWCILAIGVAVGRGRPRVAVAVAGVLILAPLNSELLKRLVAHSYTGAPPRSIGSATWPSATSTAALALTLSAVLAAPPRLRVPLATLGSLFAGAIGAALLIRQAHRPSDVLGGYLMAGMWTALAVAGLRTSYRHRPPCSGRLIRPANRPRSP